VLAVSNPAVLRSRRKKNASIWMTSLPSMTSLTTTTTTMATIMATMR
jgi:hypothetical protein